MSVAKCIDILVTASRVQRFAGRRAFIALIAALMMLALAAKLSRQASGAAARPPEAAGKPSSTAERLSARQQLIAGRFRHLEEVLLRMAELTAASDPQRAELLRKAVVQSKEQLIGVRFERLVELLEQQRLSQALDLQADLQRDLQRLMQLLLSENRQQRIDEQQTRLRRHIKQLDRIIREQRALQGRSEGSNQLRRLAGGQGELARKTGRLATEIARGGAEAKAGGGSGKPADMQTGGPGKGENGAGDGPSGSGGNSSGESSGDSAARPAEGSSQENDGQAGGQVQAARDRMKEAQKALENARRDAALEKQEAAVRRLQEAKARLEKILRQLREEEMKRMLATLQARFANMLKLEQEVYHGTLRLDQTSEKRRRHAGEIAAVRLSRQQWDIAKQADKVLLLLRDDGTAVAFPEVVAQMRDDMQEAAERLGGKLTGQITQSIEKDIMSALEEMIEALRVERKNLEAADPQQSQSDSKQGEPRLIQELAELKMIRTLQLRINRRTVSYAKLLDTQEAHNMELREALRRLAAREAKIKEITRKLGEQHKAP